MQHRAAPPTRAIVRAPSASLVHALGQEDGVVIDLERARAQHAAYVAALAALGVEIVALPPLDAHPDACFVEDTAVIFGAHALVTRPGAPSRQGEAASVGDALAALGLALTVMHAPATLDGGDVMRVGKRFFVGRSARTNDAGIEALAAFARSVDRDASVVALDMPADLLHLKCDTSPLGDDAVLAVEGLPLDLPPGLTRIDVPRTERFAANAVAIGRQVLVAAHHPETHARLAAAGYEPHPVDTSELRKAAGALTCLSLLVTA